MKKKITRVSVSSYEPIRFKNGPRTVFDPTLDERFYDLRHDSKIRKFGWTEQTFSNLVKQYKGLSRGQHSIYDFQNFVEVEWSLLENKMGIGHCSKYDKTKRDQCVRDYAISTGLAKIQDSVPDLEALDTLGKTWTEIISAILGMKPKKLSTHSFIDDDVSEIRSSLDSITSGTALLVIAYKCPRYWKDYMALNILANTNDKTDMIAPSVMFTTHSGLERKTLSLAGFEVFDLKNKKYKNYSVLQLQELRNNALYSDKKCVWLVSGYERSTNPIHQAFFESIDNNAKIIDIDEVDFSAWKKISPLLKLSGLASDSTGKPVIVLKTGTGMDKIAVMLSESKFNTKIFEYEVKQLYRMTTQQCMEIAKVEGDPSVSHVLHKCEIEVELDPNDLAVLNNTDIVSEEERTGYTKIYANPTIDLVKGLLDPYLIKERKPGVYNASYVHNIVNKCVGDIIRKYPSIYSDIDSSEYNFREVVGVQINTASRSYEGYDPLLANIKCLYGDRWLIVGTKETKRETIEAFIRDSIKSAFDDNQFVTQGGKFVGFVLLAPGWTMLGRSFTEGLIDLTLELKDKLDGQHNNRSLSSLDRDFNNGLTIDNKKKLIGCSVHLRLGDEDRGTIDEVYEQYALASSGPQSKGGIPLYSSVFNIWTIIRNNLIQLNDTQINARLDMTKALGQSAMADANWELMDRFTDRLIRMRTVSKTGANRKIEPGKTIIGRLAGKKLAQKFQNGNATDSDKAKLYAALENYQFGVDILAQYSNILQLPKSSTVIDIAKQVMKMPVLSKEFETELYIPLRNWVRLYNVGIFKQNGKNKHQLILDKYHDEYA